MRTKFSELYVRVRTGKVFLIGVCLFCGTWAAWNLIPGLPHFDDPALGRLTTILSVEASIAASLILAANERAEAIDRKTDERHEQMLAYISHMMEAIVAVGMESRPVAPPGAGVDAVDRQE